MSRTPAQLESGSLSSGLSTRERQLLQLAARGHTDQSIANQLGISLATVGTYWGRVRIKLGPYNRTELVAKFLKEHAERTVALLREENAGLLQQIEEKSRTEQMLRASLEMFRGLLETAPDAILIVDQNGSIQFANEQTSELFGYTSEELSKLKVEDLIPVRYHQQHLVHRSNYNDNPVKRRMGQHLATIAVTKDGTEFPMAAALSAAETPNGLLVTCIVRDLSATK